jgi:ATP-binding cassette, subfamily C (CFTR/MRP), member 1
MRGLLGHASVIVYIYSENDFNIDILFLLLTFMQTARFPISLISNALNAVAEGMVSFRRISKFLCLDELDNEDVLEKYTLPEDKHLAIEITNGSFSWNKLSDVKILDNVNIQIKKGALVAIIGKVGSGKSSILSATMQEMHRIHGDVRVSGSLAYVSQSSWIQSKSIRDNILFNRIMDSSKYETVLYTSGLLEDLRILPDGDKTEIGERGE